MASAVSTIYYNRVILSTKLLLLAIGFFICSSVLVAVTENKLNHLRETMSHQDAAVVTAAERTKQLDCLTKNIYWEAGSEPFEGKVAVAQVTMNRVNSGRFGTGVCGVVYQKNIMYEKVICQFSWACENNFRTHPVYPQMYAESAEVAKKVLLENFRLPSLNQALYFHAANINPGWHKEKLAQIGQHIFYKE